MDVFFEKKKPKVILFCIKGKRGKIMLADTIKIEKMIEEYSDMVYRLAMSRTGSKENSEDIFQNVFLKLYQKNPTFQSKEHEKAWIIRVTINESKNLMTSAWIRHREDLTKQIQSEAEEKVEIYEEILSLPVKERTLIYLYYYEGLKIREISKILRMSEGAIKTRLRRIRKKLKQNLEGGWEDEEK